MINLFIPRRLLVHSVLLSVESFLSFQKDHYEEQIKIGNLPTLGVFKPGAPEIAFWSEYCSEHEMLDYDTIVSRYKSNKIDKYSALRFPLYDTIVSLDYKTGTLYAGFTNIPFLEDKFFKDFYVFSIWRENDKRAIRRALIQEPRFKIFQNAQGELYDSGDTLLNFVVVLSSDDLKLIQE
jgi:hypothetical protein